MDTLRVATCALNVVLLGLLASGRVVQAQPASPSGITSHTSASGGSKKAIQAVLDAQLRAWNRGDIDGFMAGYWNSPEFTYLTNKHVVRGWQAMLDLYRQSFKSPGASAMGNLELLETQITLLGKDAALVWGTYRVTNPDGKQRGGLYTLIMRKFPEGWRTVYDRTSSEPLTN